MHSLTHSFSWLVTYSFTVAHNRKRERQKKERKKERERDKTNEKEEAPDDVVDSQVRNQGALKRRVIRRFEFLCRAAPPGGEYYSFCEDYPAYERTMSNPVHWWRHDHYYPEQNMANGRVILRSTVMELPPLSSWRHIFE